MITKDTYLVITIIYYLTGTIDLLYSYALEIFSENDLSSWKINIEVLLVRDEEYFEPISISK